MSALARCSAWALSRDRQNGNPCSACSLPGSLRCLVARCSPAQLTSCCSTLDFMNPFEQKLSAHCLTLKRAKLQTLQINVGRKCNQTCRHCHVDAAPWRTE